MTPDRPASEDGWAEAGERRRAVARVLAVVLVANIVVILAKVVVGFRSGSIAVWGDAAHSGIDALNNVVGLTAMRLAAAPPDEMHPYGHGKFETLAALAVAAFLSVTCFELLQSAIGRLATGGAAPRIEPAMIAVLGVAMVLNVFVAWGEGRAARRLSSEMLLADARHTAADVLVTAAVLGGLVLIRMFGWTQADAILALLVAVVVARSGYEILRDTIPVLVDERATEPAKIRAVAREVEGVVATSSIRSRGRPGEGFAELTIFVHRDETVVSAHEIADRVELRVADEVGFANVIVHVEPVETTDDDARTRAVGRAQTPESGSIDGAASRSSMTPSTGSAESSEPASPAGSEGG
ncbi:MAG: cation diffusion facilitator family transporter [Gemmatimonadota bacterium]|nr:cation diffusion facilitator family transporter [Gemmatimonadota bacterium]